MNLLLNLLPFLGFLHPSRKLQNDLNKASNILSQAQSVVASGAVKVGPKTSEILDQAEAVARALTASLSEESQ